MKILYVAADQRVPGTTGGAVHVAAVADGLAALGHEVHVAASRGNGPFPAGTTHWHAVDPPFRSPRLRLVRAKWIRAYARMLRPDVIIERYHNFGGEGVLAAAHVGALAVLEVNAPIIDYPGSPKRWVDRALLIQPMRRWREWQCRRAGLVVTPLADIVPAWIPRERILEIEWGADTSRFRPGAQGEIPYGRRPGDTVVVFAGAFRAWHGAIHLVRAMAQLRARGRTDIVAVLIGDGPEAGRVRCEAAALDGVTVVGPVSHDRMPACLAAADMGVAPFDVSAHGPLQIGFYWSPLKVFEYMASGLPVVAPNVERLNRLVRHGHEGVLYDAGDPAALSEALERLADAENRVDIGEAARQRAVDEFGWDAHCRALEQAIQKALDHTRRTTPAR
ncbi:MAG: glycosyltransferase family 4 protein [Vicinamibacterales bacterium]|jgi:glycosyltransferase involved in cell wall biosynthesis|nr:glycosyltransferase family 4 protein [Vicinamibacterales bacterium]MDP6607531.1 glycosyltransferase family 4 protein [Vicinamibacterales bacterium]|tara:strand:+ start:16172 stop:17344 length:1173 start_codon:yes stop_codon:yes gene_type:complete